MNRPTIREANESDLDGILDTLRLALGETPVLKRTPELWAWKHELNPFGRSIVFVAEQDETIAGVRALMRWRLQTPEGHSIQCARPVDTATHPEFARRGIFRSLTMAALEVARAQHIDLIFNTPNDKSAPGYISMGWGHVSWIGVQGRLRLGRAVAPPSTGPPSIAVMAPKMDRSHAIPESMPGRELRGMGTVRDADYIDWRFRRHPTASYGWMGDGTGAGGVVARASSRGRHSELVVSDLLGGPRPGVIGRTAKAARTRYLAGWFSPNSRARSITVRGGLLPVPGIRALRLVAMPLGELDRDPFDLGSWDLSTSDLELL